MESLSAQDDPPARPTSSLKLGLSLRVLVTAAAVAMFLILVDQVGKNYIVTHYSPGELIVGSPYVSLVFVTNTGGVCGYAPGAGQMLTLIGVVTTLLILVAILFHSPDSPVYAAAFGMMLAGAAGNLIDRLRFGYVVDFITVDFFRWPSFNIADASIIGGISLIGLLAVWEIIRDRSGGRGPMTAGIRLDKGTILLVAAAGLLFAVAYVLCVFRPLG